MSEAKLLEVADNKAKPREHGRRVMDKVAYGMLKTEKVLKFAVGVVAALCALILAVITGGSAIYAAWIDAQTQAARNAVPPAMVRKETK